MDVACDVPRSILMVLSVVRVPSLAIGRNTEHFNGAFCSACAALSYWT